MMNQTAETAVGDEIASIGQAGELVLDYVRRGNRTVLAQSRSRSPWHLSPPIALDETGSACTFLLNPSGGLVGGDRLRLRATLGADAHVILSTPSANRVYRSLAEPSVQSVELIVGPGAILEWVPDVTIPFAGSRYHQTVHVSLASGATILLWDVIASGRIARGERWAFADLANEIQITTASGGRLLERYRLTPTSKEDSEDGVGLAGGWDYIASLYVVNDTVEVKVWDRMEESLAKVLADCPNRVSGGVSQPAVPGLAVKLVARSAPDLDCVWQTLWSAIRGHLWGFPTPALRRY
ncbi:MAG: urease accessory protein UreD [Nitrospirae bacterium]|nr:MAG: urease accessory protein UreD [Nitrospirota bacterium]